MRIYNWKKTYKYAQKLITEQYPHFAVSLQARSRSNYVIFVGTSVSGTHTVTMILIEVFNHEIATAQLRLSEIVLNYSRPLWEAQFSSIYSFPLPRILQAG